MDHSSQVADIMGGELASHGRQANAVPGRDERSVDRVIRDARVLAVKRHWWSSKHMVCVVKEAARESSEFTFQLSLWRDTWTWAGQV